MSDVQTALIIGAGPAGLTAALELIRHTKIIPIIFEHTSFALSEIKFHL